MASEYLTEAEAADMIGWSASNLRQRRARLDVAQASRAKAHADLDTAPQYVRLRGGSRIAYAKGEVLRWMRRHPIIADKAARVAATVSQDHVAGMLGITRGTLRARRARRVNGDKLAAPPHLHAGQEVRYLEREVVRWAESVTWGPLQ